MHFCTSVWCFSFVTLCNLQGTRAHRSPVNICYSNTAFPLCQALFSSFLKIFRSVSASQLVQIALLFYHNSARLSSFSSNFSEVFCLARSLFSSLAEQLDYFTKLFRICQALFSDFSKFLSAVSQKHDRS